MTGWDKRRGVKRSMETEEYTKNWFDYWFALMFALAPVATVIVIAWCLTHW